MVISTLLDTHIYNDYMRTEHGWTPGFRGKRFRGKGIKRGKVGDEGFRGKME